MKKKYTTALMIFINTHTHIYICNNYTHTKTIRHKQQHTIVPKFMLLARTSNAKLRQRTRYSAIALKIITKNAF